MPIKPKSHAERLYEQNKGNRDYRKENKERYQSPEDLKLRAIRTGSRWRKVRNLYIQQHPLCEDPFNYHKENNETTLAQEVHHVTPARIDTEQFYSFDNLQALCKRCHARRTNLERVEGYPGGDEGEGGVES